MIVNISTRPPAPGPAIPRLPVVSKLTFDAKATIPAPEIVTPRGRRQQCQPGDGRRLGLDVAALRAAASGLAHAPMLEVASLVGCGQNCAPIAYAVVNDFSEQQRRFFLEHGGTHCINFDTSGADGWSGFDRIFEAIATAAVD